MLRVRQSVQLSGQLGVAQTMASAETTSRRIDAKHGGRMVGKHLLQLFHDAKSTQPEQFILFSDEQLL